MGQSATSDGSTLIVKAKDESYTCTSAKTGYSCKSDSGGEEFEVAESEEGAPGEATPPETSDEPPTEEADG